MKKIKEYYDIRQDLKLYPDAWTYLIFGGRSSGKTYSALRMCIEDKAKFVFVKRTKRDVNFICKCSDNTKGYNIDISPFKPLNRDFNYNIYPVQMDDGFGAFFIFKDGEAVGEPVGYICALSMIKDLKGFDLSECDYIIFDEFIPKKWERIYNKREGDDLLDLYMTIRRDRISRGRNDLKLICLANGVNISNSTFNVLEVVDDVASMPEGDQVRYIEDREILLHKIPTLEEDKELSGIEKAMVGTEWFDMAFSGEFAYDDFSNVGKLNLKRFSPVCKFIHKRKEIYIYQSDEKYYITNQKSNKINLTYDLSLENHQKAFYNEIVFDMRAACIDGKVLFQKFSYYDIIVNFKKFYNIN